MKKNILLFISIIVLLTGCALLGNSPKDEVEKFLNNYKNNSESVINELNDYLDTQNLDDETYDDYRELYLRQYSNLKYEIKDERINGDDAVVEVQITVFDYYKTDKLSGDYLSANKAEFVDEKGDVDFSKYFSYKIKKLLDTTDTVDYTLTISLSKEDDRWVIEPLSTEELRKLHGTYEY